MDSLQDNVPDGLLPGLEQSVCLFNIDKLEKKLVAFYHNRIKIKEKLLGFIETCIILIKNGLSQHERYPFEFTFYGHWDQKHKRWAGESMRLPDWQISLPWAVKTRGFPKYVMYKKGSEEMKKGIELQNIILDSLDDLMFENRETAIEVYCCGSRVKVGINVRRN